MAKGFRLRFSWVIPSFSSCRSKDDAACSPVFRVSQLNPKAFDVDFPLPHVPPRNKLHVKPYCRRCGLVRVVCRCVRSNRPQWDPCVDGDSNGLSSESVAPLAYQWRKDENWHVVAHVKPSPARRKIDSDDGGREVFPPLPIHRRRRRTVTAKKKKKGAPKTKYTARVSTSSADTSWFSSEDEREFVEDYDYHDETELLMSSSRSFSTDYSSPEPNHRLKPIREHPDHQQTGAVASTSEPAAPHSLPQRKSSSPLDLGRGACPSRPESSSSTSRRAPSASSVLRRFVTPPLRRVLVEGKVRDSFAVVKRSEDPYSDFRRSMVEMVVENHMYEERDLEQLLHCFLLLNSRRHHPAIIRAFSDIWAAFLPSSHNCTSAAATPPPSVSS